MKKIQNVLDRLVDNRNVFGTALRIETLKGEVIFSGGSGNLDDNKKYFIASTTKLYTTAIIYKLISEGKLSLENKLDTFFDSNIVSGLNVYKKYDYSDQITIRDLLAHTSGIPDHFSGKIDGQNLESKLMMGEDRSWDWKESIDLAKTMNS